MDEWESSMNPGGVDGNVPLMVLWPRQRAGENHRHPPAALSFVRWPRSPNPTENQESSRECGISLSKWRRSLRPVAGECHDRLAGLILVLLCRSAGGSRCVAAFLRNFLLWLRLWILACAYLRLRGLQWGPRIWCSSCMRWDNFMRTTERCRCV